GLLRAPRERLGLPGGRIALEDPGRGGPVGANRSNGHRPPVVTQVGRGSWGGRRGLPRVVLGGGRPFLAVRRLGSGSCLARQLGPAARARRKRLPAEVAHWSLPIAAAAGRTERRPPPPGAVFVPLVGAVVLPGLATVPLVVAAVPPGLVAVPLVVAAVPVGL